MGPMTGRGFGYCTGYGTPGYMAPQPGRGFWGGGRGRGWGRGWRRGYGAGFGGPVAGVWVQPGSYGAPAAPAMTREQELDMLRSQSEYFQQTLDGLRRRIEEIETKRSEPGA